MAYVLSLRPHSPLKRSFSDNPCLHSCPPLSENTVDALRDITTRNASASSLYSMGSIPAGKWLSGNENKPPPITSRSLLDLSHGEQRGGDAGSIKNVPRKRSCGMNRPPPTFSHTLAPPPLRPNNTENIAPSLDLPADKRNAPVPMIIDDIDGGCDKRYGSENSNDLLDLYDAIHIPLPDGRFSDSTGSEAATLPPMQPPIRIEVSPPPFKRWMSTLRRRHVQRRKEQRTEPQQWLFDAGHSAMSMLAPLPYVPECLRRKSESTSSSMGCVTGLKSASITLASASIAPRSDGGAFHGQGRHANRGSHYSDARRSTDSNPGVLGPVIDEGAWLRSMQRRRIVEEIISSEESYIGDLKVLINDYFALLASVPTVGTHMRALIQQNISQILHLHQDLLAELHQAVPHADFMQSAHQESYPITKAKHIRFHSADMMPGRFHEHKAARRLRHSLEIGRSPDRRPRALVADTKTVGEVAKIFNKYMKRFFAYEEYGAHWTTMSHDLTSMCKGFQGWNEYERGIEALSKLVASENNKEASSRKALSFSDLLIKPIQRVCKYPLLFDDLCRHTPVYDDPEAHAELEKTVFRFQETIREVNKAKDDPKTRRLIEISWLLQDRLVFEQQALPRALVFRLLGHVRLCGVLHVAHQGQEQMRGQYMMCALYRSCLVLATTNRSFLPYNVVASISLANGTVEEPDNGRGLQCHTAPHTWKLVFEHGHRLHEIILSACSSQEEEVWKTQLRERIVCETHDFVDGEARMQDMISSLSLDIRSIGPVFGHADSLVRRMSVHRAKTLGAKQHATQVIIKNTQAQKTPDPPPSFAPNSVSRSQSHMSVSHVATLAPRRAERIRLETALEEVWTKDLLPFPGMATRRTENPIRASANSVMRKLSMASIASNFSRRSPSFSSLSNTHRSDESFGSRVHKMSHRDLRARSAADRRPAPAVVDFHSAPAAFLPTDFEIQDVRPSSRRRRLANRAGGTVGTTMECSSEKAAASSSSSSSVSAAGNPKPKRTMRLSTHMISLPRTDERLETRTFSSGSGSTVLHASEVGAFADVGRYGEGEGGRGKEREREREREDGGMGGKGMPHGGIHGKKFLRNKSRIFKFWM
ncbi:Rho guanyl nucleotide exchange factor [Clohesyomyces aquaticus]|uniref:Rho guanyl nucleotide exchange factor n=1 Tax=Clohesyomyces aquaticus TaxID=1231657 RepID=A0A1Y1ZZM1_9PLEO|nr:Rho guanyl nucleotide exchange factor [Clohesyomyces aquaticus]